MAANGNPVFETVGGDASSATVSPDGGKTSQTIAALAQGQNKLAANIANAAQDASDAKSEAAQATEDAQGAKNAVNNLGNTYVKQSAIGAVNGVAGLDSAGSLNVTSGGYGAKSLRQTVFGCFGVYEDNKGTPGVNYGAIQFGNASGGSSKRFATFQTWSDGASGTNVSFTGDSIHPQHSDAALGRADSGWANIYAQKAVTVLSDLADKTVLESLGVTSNAEGETLAKALMAVPPIGYQVNSAIALKGKDKARTHYGYGAQTVRDAIKGAGLDPAKYALWTQTQRTDVTQVDSGRKDAKGNAIMVPVGTPAVDATGAPIYIEMLVYSQIHTLLIWYVNKTVSDLAARIAALESKAAGSAA